MTIGFKGLELNDIVNISDITEKTTSNWSTAVSAGFVGALPKPILLESITPNQTVNQMKVKNIGGENYLVPSEKNTANDGIKLTGKDVTIKVKYTFTWGSAIGESTCPELFYANKDVNGNNGMSQINNKTPNTWGEHAKMLFEGVSQINTNNTAFVITIEAKAGSAA